nr:conserved hypothetical protein [uncultured bacterium]
MFDRELEEPSGGERYRYAQSVGALGDETTEDSREMATDVGAPALLDDDLEFPIADYDDLRIDEIVPLLPELYADEIEVVRSRERAGANRGIILRRLDVLESRLANAPPSASAREVDSPVPEPPARSFAPPAVPPPAVPPPAVPPPAVPPVPEPPARTYAPRFTPPAVPPVPEPPARTYAPRFTPPAVPPVPEPPARTYAPRFAPPAVPPPAVPPPAVPPVPEPPARTRPAPRSYGPASAPRAPTPSPATPSPIPPAGQPSGLKLPAVQPRTFDRSSKGRGPAFSEAGYTPLPDRVAIVQEPPEGKPSGFPIEDYYQLRVIDILAALSDLDADEVEKIRRYEVAGACRAPILRQIELLSSIAASATSVSQAASAVPTQRRRPRPWSSRD